MGNTLFTFAAKADWQAGTVPPQIDLDSEPGKVKLYRPALTFSRGSAAYLPDGTLVPSGSPRYVAGKFGQAIMIEEGTRNLFTNGGWMDGTKTGWSDYGGATGTATVETDPQFGYRLVLNRTGPPATSDRWGIQQVVTIAVAPGAPITNTIYLKVVSATAGAKLICYTDYTNGTAYNYGRGYNIDLTTVANTTGPCPDTAAITPLGGGWYKLVFTHPDTDRTSGGLYYWIEGANAQVQLARSQNEAKSYGTSFTAGTRNAETITMPTTGISTTQGTIEFWVRPSATALNAAKLSSGSCLFGHTSTAANRWDMWLNVSSNNNAVGMYNGAVGRWLFSTAPAFQPDTLHHVAVTWHSINGTKLYVDGQPAGSDSAMITVPPLSDTLYWGYYPGSSWVYNSDSLFDDVRISTVARTAAEILASYNATAPLAADADTLALLHFDGTLISEYPASGTLITKAFDLGGLHEMPLRLDMPTSGGNVVIQYQSSPNGTTGWQPWLDMQGDKTSPYVGPWIRFKMVLYAAP